MSNYSLFSRTKLSSLIAALLISAAPQAYGQTRVATHPEFVTAITTGGSTKNLIFDSANILFDGTHDSRVTPALGNVTLNISSEDHGQITFQGSFTDGSLGTVGDINNNHTGRFLTKQGSQYNNNGDQLNLVFDTDTIIRDFGVKGEDDNGQYRPVGQGGAIYHYIESGINSALTISGSGNVTFYNNTALGGSALNNRTDSNGLGGAISGQNVYLQGSGTYTFDSNKAIGGDALVEMLVVAGHGGAINASSVYLSGDGDYVFRNNLAEVGDNTGARDSNWNGQGGAIWIGAEGKFTGSGNILFEGNTARTGSVTGQNTSIADSGGGGALYGDRFASYTFDKSGQVVFKDNQAFGGDSSDQGNGTQTGTGGAISMWNTVTMTGDADYTFENNRAVAGAAYNNGNTKGSGSGGAIFGSANLEGTGTYRFSGNQAIGSDSDGAGSDGSFSGVGGVIRGRMTWNGEGTYIFDGNKAIGGKATNGGNSSISGLGGAITAFSDSVITGGTFTNNKASTTNIGDLTSGRGGAIFIGPLYTSFPISYNMTATADNPLIFKGNTHNPGGTGETANSLYYGSLITRDNTINSTFNVEDGAQLLMYDPMASQEDGLTDSSGTTYGNVTANITKTGGGSWVLAGHNDFRGASNWDITEGTLHLIPTEPLTRAAASMAPAHINLSHADSSFTLRSGASLALTPARAGSGSDVYHQITANEISLEGGSRVALAGFSYGAMLGSGRHEILKLNAGDESTLNNQNVIDAQDASGTIMVGAYSYDFDNLHWETPDLLVLDASDGVLVPEPGGVPNIIAPIVVATNNPANRVIYNQINARMSDLLTDRCRGRMDKERYIPGVDTANRDDDYYSCLKDTSVWITPNYTYADYSGGDNRISYDLNMPSITLGIDHYLSDKILVGAAATFSPAKFRGADASIDADALTWALYGGALLPKKIELGLQAAFSNVDYDYHRKVFDTRYHGDYKSKVALFGLELGRTFDLNDCVDIRPWISYEYLRVKTDGFKENSPEAYALDISDHTENLHRLWAGGTLRGRVSENAFIEGDLYYLGQYGDTDVNARAVFVNDPSQNKFKTFGEAVDKHMGGLGLRAGLNLNQNTDLTLGYDLKVGENAQVHHGALTFRYSW